MSTCGCKPGGSGLGESGDAAVAAALLLGPTGFRWRMPIPVPAQRGDRQSPGAQQPIRLPPLASQGLLACKRQRQRRCPRRRGPQTRARASHSAPPAAVEAAPARSYHPAPAEPCHQTAVPAQLYRLRAPDKLTLATTPASPSAPAKAAARTWFPALHLHPCRCPRPAIPARMADAARPAGSGRLLLAGWQAPWSGSARRQQKQAWPPDRPEPTGFGQAPKLPRRSTAVTQGPVSSMMYSPASPRPIRRDRPDR